MANYVLVDELNQKEKNIKTFKASILPARSERGEVTALHTVISKPPHIRAARWLNISGNPQKKIYILKFDLAEG